jgi:hypothetical protein
MTESSNPIGDALSKAEYDMTTAPMLDACRGYLEEIKAHPFKISEAQFVRDLLPVLAGEEGTAVDLTFWFHNTGSWFRPIHVVDDKGSELFVVPPFFNRKAVGIREQQDDLDSLASDLDLYERKRQLDPGVANNFLMESFSRRVVDNTDYEEDLNNMNSILARYGKPPIHAIVNGVDSVDTAATESKVNENGFSEDAFISGGLD